MSLQASASRPAVAPRIVPGVASFSPAGFVFSLLMAGTLPHIETTPRAVSGSVCLRKCWRARRDSNPRPPGPQPGALSTELRAHSTVSHENGLAEREGFEPSRQVTPPGGLANRCTRPLCDLSRATAAGILAWPTGVAARAYSIPSSV